MLCHAVLHSVNVAWPNTTCTFVCSPMRNHSRAFEALRSYFFLLSHLRYIRCTFCLCLHDSSAAAKFVHFVFLLFRLFWHRSMCGNLFAIRLEATSTATNADKKMCDELTAEAILIIERTWKTALIQTIALSNTFEIWRHEGWKLPRNISIDVKPAGVCCFVALASLLESKLTKRCGGCT